jgi:hypothetical protein
VRRRPHPLQSTDGHFRTLRPIRRKLGASRVPGYGDNYFDETVWILFLRKSTTGLGACERVRSSPSENPAQGHRSGNPRRDRTESQTDTNRRGLRGRRFPVPISEWRPGRIHGGVIRVLKRLFGREFRHPALQQTSSGLPDEAVVMLSWRNRSEQGPSVEFVTLASRALGDSRPAVELLASCQLTTLILPAPRFPGSWDPPAALRPSYPARRYAPLYLCRSAKPL